jgi:hypothetical protein
VKFHRLTIHKIYDKYDKYDKYAKTDISNKKRVIFNIDGKRY